MSIFSKMSNYPLNAVLTFPLQYTQNTNKLHHLIQTWDKKSCIDIKELCKILYKHCNICMYNN